MSISNTSQQTVLVNRNEIDNGTGPTRAGPLNATLQTTLTGTVQRSVRDNAYLPSMVAKLRQLEQWCVDNPSRRASFQHQLVNLRVTPAPGAPDTGSRTLTSVTSELGLEMPRNAGMVTTLRAELEREISAGAQVSESANQRSSLVSAQPPTRTLHQVLADQQYLVDMTNALKKVEASSSRHPLDTGRLAQSLRAFTVQPVPGSSYTLPKSLATAITDLGLALPTNFNELIATRRQLEQMSSLSFNAYVNSGIQQSASGTSSTTLPQRVTPDDQPPSVKPLRQLLADKQDLKSLVEHLHKIARQPNGTPTTSEHISYALNHHTLMPFIGSHYALTQRTPPTLATVLTDHGIKLPSTVDELFELTQDLEHIASLNLLGNLGGGLSWPIPLSKADQKKIIDFLASDTTGLPGLPVPSNTHGTLGYLLSGSSVIPGAQEDPAQLLQQLLDSPKAHALGKALQDRLGGTSSDTSIYEYLLTAIHLGLDPATSVINLRNNVRGFDLAQPSNWGKSPATIVENLRRHLLARDSLPTGLVNLATHILLSREAPQFLVKDIPDHVKIGSQAWTNLSIAAATLEAERPGSVANMTYAQVMAYKSSSPGRSVDTEYAQRNALADWGIANGLIQKNEADTYPEQQIETVRKMFNMQLNGCLSASKTMDKGIPTRKEIALAKLKERFGDLGALFEEKVLSTDQYRGDTSQTGLVGMHSLLDVAMMDLPNPRPFTSSDPRIPLEALNNNPRFGVKEVFDQQFSSAIREKKIAVATTIKHLLSQLPLEDRKNFEFGKLTFLQEGSYTWGEGFFDTPPVQNKPELLVKTERNGVTQAYVINFNTGSIEQTRLSRARSMDSREGNVISTTRVLTPEDSASELSRERPVAAPFNSFSSDRSHSIAYAFVQHLNLDDPAIKESARGQTTLDELQGGPKPLNDLLLNLIPFRSAIVNFMKGNYGDGLFDLTLDVFGFLTAGAATAGKLIKIGSSALSSGAKLSKGARVIGAAAIGVLNPVSGLGDLAAGGANLIYKGVRKLIAKGSETVNRLKGATGSYDLLKAASEQYGVVATGTYKVGEQAIESSAVLHNGKWYAYDPVTVRPYGPPLPMFNAKSIAMGGEMQNFKILGNGLGMSEDMTKRGLRLTLDAHGAIPSGQSSALMSVNGDLLTPNEVVDLLRAHNVDMSKYTEVRLTVCHSGNGGAQSFAAQFSRITHKPTEGYLGVMYAGGEVEDIAAQMFKPGGAKQREYIEQHINGQKKRVTKYEMKTQTGERLGHYTVSPDYNPVRFDADGNLMPAKPGRAPYTAEKVVLPETVRRHSEVNFSEYDDLT